LETLQVVLGSGVGTLQAELALHQALEQGDLARLAGSFVEKGIVLYYLHAVEFPLRDRHLLDVELFGGGARAPFELEGVAKLVEVAAVLALQYDGAGAQAVPDGLQVESRFDLFGFFDFFDLFWVFHIVFEPSKPIQGWFRFVPAYSGTAPDLTIAHGSKETGFAEQGK
jgi:hypothetical protein